ncbi:MAG: sigma 54-interacting transcriptional regulator [Candidatus Acidiferrales bacterium]
MSISPQLALGESPKRYEALLRATAAIAACRDCESFEGLFAGELRRVVAFDYLNFVIFDESDSTVQWRLFESTVKSAVISGAEVPAEETTSNWVYKNQQPLVIVDWGREARFQGLKRILSELSICSTCTLPLTTAHRRFGVIEVGSSRPNAYPEEEVSFLSLVANHVALTIEGALNFEEAHRAQAELESKNERLNLLLDLTNHIVSNLDLRDLLRAISASVRRVMKCDAAGVMLPNSQGSHLRVYAQDFPESKGFAKEENLIPIEGTPPGIAFRTGKPLVGKLQDFPSFEAEAMNAGKAEGFKIGCFVPLISRSRVLGLLGLGRFEENPLTQDDVDFLAQIASQVAIAVENALAYGEIAELRDRLAQEKLYLEDEIRGEMDFEGIVGQSTALRHVLQLVETVAPSDSTVLLLGETGTGKELIARAIHERSRRRDRTLVKLNCAAIPTGLLESELFGHEKGAFTGAVSQKVGRLELADKGSLFLDEVGDIPLEVQPKLLRALQEREFERLGNSRTMKVDIRLVAATNRDLEKMVADRQFRSDLYYRLNVFPIRIPPLRERPDDISLLMRYFAQKYAQRMEKQIESIPAAAIRKLTRWHWPGNIRELENFIERAVILSRGTTLEVPLSELKNDAAAPVPVAGTREWNEREEILRILKEAGGRVGGADGAAARMGIKRTTLISRIKKLGIDPRAVS